MQNIYKIVHSTHIREFYWTLALKCMNSFFFYRFSRCNSPRLPTHRRGAYRKFFRWSLLNLKLKCWHCVAYIIQNALKDYYANYFYHLFYIYLTRDRLLSSTDSYRRGDYRKFFPWSLLNPLVPTTHKKCTNCKNFDPKTRTDHQKKISCGGHDYESVDKTKSLF